MQRRIELTSLVVLAALCAVAIWLRPDAASAAEGEQRVGRAPAAATVPGGDTPPGMVDRFHEEKRRAAIEPLPAQF